MPSVPFIDLVDRVRLLLFRARYDPSHCSSTEIREAVELLAPGAITPSPASWIGVYQCRVPPSGLDALAHAVAASIKLARLGYGASVGYEETPPESA